jgi:hypothetical protein
VTVFPTTDCTKCGKTFPVPSQFYANEPDRLCDPCITAWAEAKPCPDCEGGPIVTSKKENWFQYGPGSKGAKIKCLESLRTCKACDFQFLDYQNERNHLAAINRYLILTGQEPREK